MTHFCVIGELTGIQNPYLGDMTSECFPDSLLLPFSVTGSKSASALSQLHSTGIPKFVWALDDFRSTSLLELLTPGMFR